jgi:hypothetical protein
MKERNRKTGLEETIVSHGIDLNNDDRIVILPQEPPWKIGAVMDPDIGEYVLLEYE